MNVPTTAIPGRYEAPAPQLWAPAEISDFAEPERPRNPLPGILASIALGLGLWGGILAIILF